MWLKMLVQQPKVLRQTVLTLMIWIIDTAESIGRITEKEAENYKSE